MSLALTIILSVIMGALFSVQALYLIHSGKRSFTTEKYGSLSAVILFLAIYLHNLTKGVHSEGWLIVVIAVGITFVVVCVCGRLQK